MKATIMNFLRKWIHSATQPTSLIYFLLHLVLVISGFLLYKMYPDRPFLMGVGSSMVAAGITGFVIFTYLLVARDAAEVFKALSRFGIVNAFERRGVSERAQYDQRLRVVGEHIDVMGFGLKTLRQDYIDEFANWKRRAHVRILIVDPTYPPTHGHADQRDVEEGDRVGSIREDVEEFISATRHLFDEHFQVRLYRCLPSINIFRMDDEIFWGPYLLKTQSRNMPTFIVRKGGLLFDQMLTHFESIWTSDQFSRNPDINDGTDTTRNN